MKLLNIPGSVLYQAITYTEKDQIKTWQLREARSQNTVTAKVQNSQGEQFTLRYNQYFYGTYDQSAKIVTIAACEEHPNKIGSAHAQPQRIG